MNKELDELIKIKNENKGLCSYEVNCSFDSFWIFIFIDNSAFLTSRLSQSINNSFIYSIQQAYYSCYFKKH